MKLYFVVQRYGDRVIGGAEAACRQLALRMSSSADVTVLTTCAEESTSWANSYPAGEARDQSVRVLRFPTASKRASRFEALSQKLFRKPQPSRRLEEKWVRAQGPYSPSLIKEIAKRADEPDLWIFYTYLYHPTIAGLPHVSDRSVLHPALHDEPPARLGIVREALRSPAGISLQTNEEWKLLIRFAGWPRAQIRLVGMGADDERGNPDAFRKKAGLDLEPYLLYLGRVDRGKGTDQLALDFIRFKSSHPSNLKLVIAGPLVHEPPSHDDIITTGPLSEDERWDALEGCEIFVHPSPFESFGIVLIEAMMKGKPALVSRHSPVTTGHAIESRGAIPYGDTYDFESALAILREEPAVARRLGESARAYAERFRWEHVIERYRSFLEEVHDRVSAGGGRSSTR